MALVHHFSVTSKCGDYYIGNDNFDKIAIHDDIILYMIDTIKWVIGFNPSKKSLLMACAITALPILIAI